MNYFRFLHSFCHTFGLYLRISYLTSKQMKIHKLLVFILLLATFVTYGQDPVLIPIPKKPMVSTRACPDMDAGSAGLYGYTGGEMASPTEVTLCANEAVFVKHNGDENLSGDPDPSTPAGIWYAAFTSEPDETGVLTPSQLADLPGIIEVDGRLMCVRADGYGSVTEITNGSFVEATNQTAPDRKSTRLNSSHVAISYAVFC